VKGANNPGGQQVCEDRPDVTLCDKFTMLCDKLLTFLTPSVKWEQSSLLEGPAWLQMTSHSIVLGRVTGTETLPVIFMAY
jgi:hypothetical protein